MLQLPGAEGITCAPLKRQIEVVFTVKVTVNPDEAEYERFCPESVDFMVVG